MKKGWKLRGSDISFNVFMLDTHILTMLHMFWKLKKKELESALLPGGKGEESEKNRKRKK